MKTTFLGILMMGLLCWCACSSEDGGPQAEAPKPVKKMELSSTSYLTMGREAMVLVKLKSADAWKLEMDEQASKWIKVTPETGEGGDKAADVKIWISRNVESEADMRECVLTFRQTTSDTVAAEFHIVQHSDYKLTQDSLALLKIAEKLGGENWLKPFDLSKPLNSWPEVTIDLHEGVNRVVTFGWDKSNNLQGEIPEEIGELTALQTLAFTDEQGLTGTLPAAALKKTQLIELHLVKCQVGGLLPAELQECKKMKLLQLRDCKFTGFEEGWTGDFPALVGFTIQNNLFDQPLTNSFIKDMVKLNIFIMNNNNFSGPVPRNLFSGKTYLTVFEMKGNRLTGDFPEEISNLYAYTQSNPQEAICPQQPDFGFTAGTCFAVEDEPEAE